MKYTLADGVSLRGTALRDTVLDQEHTLTREAAYIVRELLVHQRVSRVTKGYVQKYDATSTRASQQTYDLLIDLYKHYLLETGGVLRRRMLLTRAADLLWIGVGLLVSQLLLLLLPAFTLAIIGWALGYNFWLVGAVVSGGAWGIMWLHEAGHAWPVLRSGQRVVLLRQKYQTRLLYSHAIPPEVARKATYVGPLAAAALGMCCLMAGLISGGSVGWALQMVGVFGIGQVVHFLPLFEDGKTIKRIRRSV